MNSAALAVAELMDLGSPADVERIAAKHGTTPEDMRVEWRRQQARNLLDLDFATGAIDKPTYLRRLAELER